MGSESVEVENIRVLIRIRPLNTRERRVCMKRVTSTNLSQTQLILTNPKLQTWRQYEFDKVFKEISTQKQVYQCVAQPTVEKSLEGYNGTIFAYGQTGTGKTYTMTGVENDIEKRGIIPNVFQQIFSQISTAPETTSFLITVTYLEIHNEEIRDLLSSHPEMKLLMRERPNIGVYVKDLTGYTVDSVESITNLMKKGNSNRTIRSTEMNDVSSRSHTIFTMLIESKSSVTGKITRGKLNLVDLAGSERWKRSLTSGESRRESININQSLFVLGNVISALVDGKPNSFVPYRNSKLTRLLQDSLGGNAKTTMIATISPTEMDYDETVCTLRYARRVKAIKNTTKRNVEVNKGLIDGFEEDIENLQKELQKLRLSEIKLSNKAKKKILQKEICQNQTDLLRQNEIEKAKLLAQISNIQKKILVGNDQDDCINEISLTEEMLCKIEANETKLEEDLYLKEQERDEVELQCTTFQQEDSELTQKLKILREQLYTERLVYAEKELEHQREIETVQYDNKKLLQELQLANFVIDNYVPKICMNTIEDHIVWDKDSSDFHLVGLPHVGNNIQRRNKTTNAKKVISVERCTNKNIYRSYGTRSSDDSTKCTKSTFKHK